MNAIDRIILQRAEEQVRAYDPKEEHAGMPKCPCGRMAMNATRPECHRCQQRRLREEKRARS